MVLYFCLVLGKSLVELRQARSRVSEARETLSQAQNENEELLRRLEEVNSDEFREKEVREKLNRQLPGETVVIVPDRDFGDGESGVETTKEMANWEKWLALFR